MARRPPVRSASWSDQWWESYGRLTTDRQASCDRAVTTLIKGAGATGLVVKPILPAKYYLEARISSGERIVFRIAEGTIYFLDIVKHDDIGRYGRPPRPVR